MYLPGGPVAHCTPGVRLQGRSRHLITLYTAICSELNFRTHAVEICTVPKSRNRTVYLCCVYTKFTYMGGPVVHCAPGVRLRSCSRQITTTYRALSRKRYIRRPAVHSCTFPQSRTRTVHLVWVYTNCTYLGGPVAHCTPGVRLRDRSRQFSTPHTAISREKYFRTHAVQSCTVRRSIPRTVHLVCVYTNFTYLGGTVPQLTPGLRLRDCTRLLSTP